MGRGCRCEAGRERGAGGGARGQGRSARGGESLPQEAVGADASTLDGLPEARRKEFLDEFERDLPKDDPAPRTPPEDASEINVDWERRVQFDALRDGNALRQNDVLNKAIRTDK